MPNNGELAYEIDGITTKTITIPSGYTSGGQVGLDGTIDAAVAEQDNLIAEIMAVIDELPEAGSGGGGGDVEV
jgi:hypothetical protein